jgi:SagB-type dehydrogenase family enzyme
MHLLNIRSEKRLSEGEKSVELKLSSLSSLLYFSMSISAWKQIKGTEQKWALRVNPSSGNLHPTETHILVGEVPGISSGAYHYYVKEHKLEKRSSGNTLESVWSKLERDEGAPPLMLALTSIFWREAWKYRDRAYRYCQLDLGHAAAAISLTAANLGWRAEVIAEFSDQEVSSCLGLGIDRDEKPMLLIPIYPDLNNETEASLGIPFTPSPAKCAVYNSSSKTTPGIAGVPPAFTEQDSSKFAFTGHPNVLSSYELKYSSINSVYQAGCITQDEYRQRRSRNIEFKKPELHPGLETIELAGTSYKLKSDPSFHQTVRTRRSAVDMDGQARSSLARLGRILIDSSRQKIPEQYYIHILIYVHRIDGLGTGVYYFDREELTLTLLHDGDVRTHAKFVSCLQDIASDGIFAVSLLADMQSAFEHFGERAYRYVHQEAGFIGQLFYLSARALDIDATGIGCFIDDEINNALPRGMEVVYNFTFGKAVLDPRLTDLPAYDFADPAFASGDEPVN